MRNFSFLMKTEKNDIKCSTKSFFSLCVAFPFTTPHNGMKRKERSAIRK